MSSLSHRLRLRSLCQPPSLLPENARLDQLVVAGADGRSALDLEMFWEISVASSNDDNPQKKYVCVCVCVCVPMPTHCTTKRFATTNGIESGLFLNHAPLGQTTLQVGRVSV